MSGEKGMVDYRVESKQEAVRLVLEEHLSYAEVAVKLGLRKSERMDRQEGELSFHKPIGRPLSSQRRIRSESHV